MLKELQSLADQLTFTHENLKRQARGLTPEQLRERLPGGDWSIQDVLAHLAANESLMTDVLSGIATGDTSVLPQDYDNDRVNAKAVQSARTDSIDQVLTALEQSHLKLMSALETITVDQLARRGVHPLQGWLTAKEFLVVMYAHKETHCRELTAHARRLRKAGQSS